VIGESSLRARLADDWALPDATVEAHHGGMGSATWLVSQDGRRRVAKAVAPALRAHSGSTGSGRRPVIWRSDPGSAPR
jgi:hypothetical protein